MPPPHTVHRRLMSKSLGLLCRRRLLGLIIEGARRQGHKVNSVHTLAQLIMPDGRSAERAEFESALHASPV